jgi:hypothetical protein
MLQLAVLDCCTKVQGMAAFVRTIGLTILVRSDCVIHRPHLNMPDAKDAGVAREFDRRR